MSSGTDKIDVAYVAHLARMHLTAEETARFQRQIDAVLELVHDLRSADVEGVEPTAHAIPVKNVFRADEPAPTLEHDAAMANAPAERGGLFFVPKIIE